MPIAIPELLGANVTDAGNLFTFTENKSTVLVVNKGPGQVAGSLGVVPATATPADGRFTLNSGESFMLEDGVVLSVGIRAAVGQNANIDVIGIADTQPVPGSESSGSQSAYSSLEIAFAIFGANAYDDITCAFADNFVIPPGGGVQTGPLRALSAPISGNNYWGVALRGPVASDIQILTGAGNAAGVTAVLQFRDAGGVLLSQIALPLVQAIDAGANIIAAGSVGGGIAGPAPGQIATQISISINATALANGLAYNCGPWQFRCFRR